MSFKSPARFQGKQLDRPGYAVKVYHPGSAKIGGELHKYLLDKALLREMVGGAERADCGARALGETPPGPV